MDETNPAGISGKIYECAIGSGWDACPPALASVGRPAYAKASATACGARLAFAKLWRSKATPHYKNRLFAKKNEAKGQVFQ